MTDQSMADTVRTQRLPVEQLSEQQAIREILLRVRRLESLPATVIALDERVQTAIDAWGKAKRTVERLRERIDATLQLLESRTETNDNRYRAMCNELARVGSRLNRVDEVFDHVSGRLQALNVIQAQLEHLQQTADNLIPGEMIRQELEQLKLEIAEWRAGCIRHQNGGNRPSHVPQS
jgi:DNA repair exonuclease SbcCD ATPase subunit